ncbi:MAG: response regulator [Candidatus Marinimicrobia bacterium]|nr:response regulator [Candidatus Neomarinimicrobiota bacterium]MCF7830175.1 response regulator [Candidatus Neomarinimicrobiota bacterium]MCF7882091.1 response regulator [Candidatus Neomarinimicrobiota bacterium]
MAEGNTILIVEDEKDFARALEILLKSKNYTIEIAYDGMTGLQKARELKPDLVILDIMLPKINGYKISRLLKFDEQFQDIPIIMLTARAEKHDKEVGMETGADIYMTKPLDNKELLRNMQDLLGEQPAGDE